MQVNEELDGKKSSWKLLAVKLISTFLQTMFKVSSVVKPRMPAAPYKV